MSKCIGKKSKISPHNLNLKEKDMSYPVYLDYNATTPLALEVTDELNRALVNLWGNPSSSYGLGQSARAAIERSREAVAEMLNGNPNDIIFMSGGTEVCKNHSKKVRMINNITIVFHSSSIRISYI